MGGRQRRGLLLRGTERREGRRDGEEREEKGILQVCCGYEDPHRDRHGYGVGMGKEIPSPRQPWTLPWVWGSPWGFPWVWVWGGYRDRNSAPTAALELPQVNVSRINTGDLKIVYV